MYTSIRKHIEKFTDLTNEEWDLLLPHLEVRTLHKHQVFAEAGSVATDIGFVLEGMMRHYYTIDGEEKTTYFYFENHFVASYISCITNQPSLLTIQALSECRLVVFPYAVFQRLFQQSMTWQKFGRLLAEYLAIGLEERMVGLLTLSPEERYLELLKGTKTKILEKIPQHYVASYLGITPVSLSRIRNRTVKR